MTKNLNGKDIEILQIKYNFSCEFDEVSDELCNICKHLRFSLLLCTIVILNSKLITSS